MTVTIHLPVGVSAQTVLRRLIALAGGDRSAVRSGHTGLVVSDDLALAYLMDSQPVAASAHVRHPVPPNLAQVVRQAEQASGLAQTVAGPADDPAALQKTTRTATRRPRRTQGVST